MIGLKTFKDTLKRSQLYSDQQIIQMLEAVKRVKAEKKLKIIDIADMSRESTLVHYFDHFEASSLITLLSYSQPGFEMKIANEILSSALKLNLMNDGENFNKVVFLYKLI